MTRAVALCLSLTACQAPLWLAEPTSLPEVTGGILTLTCALPVDRCSVAPSLVGWP